MLDDSTERDRIAPRAGDVDPAQSYRPSFDPDSVGPYEAGIDAIEPERIAAALARHGDRFLGRVFTHAERVLCRGRIHSLAARFAAKEAVAKVLGTGLGAIAWREVEILANERGRPVLVLHGAAAARAARLGLRHWSVSLTHLAGFALAMVVACAGADAQERE
jgi:holo-[acyl-carrier protein] synthase